MPATSEETERAIRAFAYYHNVDQESTEFWLKQWRLSTIPKNKPVNKYPENESTRQ